MAKAKTAKAKPARKVLSAEEKEAKKLAQAAKYETAVDKYVTLNESKIGKVTVTTQAMHIRSMGCMVRTLTDSNVTEVFVPGVKIKTKKNWKYLIKDDPKSKEE